MILRADLHVHSCLSPCGSLRLSPREIARRARAAGLDAIALTDHNTARQAPAVGRCCRAAGLILVPGVEAHTSEEIHVLCLFERDDDAVAFGRRLYRRLPPIRCVLAKMGDQVISDDEGVIVGRLTRFLANATNWTLSELVKQASSAGGLAIPAHVDRPAGGLLARLGFVPPLSFPALEVSPHYDRRRDPLGLAGRHQLITGSDAHEPEDIGRASVQLEVAERSVRGVLDALRAERANGARGGPGSDATDRPVSLPGVG